MSNHYHLAVKIEEGVARSWSDKKVTRRWRALFTLSENVERWYQSADDTDIVDISNESFDGHAEKMQQVIEKIQSYRTRLCELSWSMCCLNEHRTDRSLQKMVAQVDSGTNDKALLSDMIYIDLNPVRSGIAKAPEASKYTSVKDRIEGKNIPGLVKLERKDLKELDPNNEPLPLTLPAYLGESDQARAVISLMTCHRYCRD